MHRVVELLWRTSYGPNWFSTIWELFAHIMNTNCMLGNASSTLSKRYHQGSKAWSAVETDKMIALKLIGDKEYKWTRQTSESTIYVLLLGYALVGKLNTSKYLLISSWFGIDNSLAGILESLRYFETMCLVPIPNLMLIHKDMNWKIFNADEEKHWRLL